MLNKYFYKAWIVRKDRKVCREGSVEGKFPLNALDAITEMAIKEWKRPIVRIELYEIAEDGVLVATSTVKDRVNAVLITNEKLRPSKYKSIREARKKKLEEEEDALCGLGPTTTPSMKPAESYKPPHPDLYTWHSKVSTLFTKERFNRMKAD